jgi:hypothetical protein
VKTKMDPNGLSSGIGRAEDASRAVNHYRNQPPLHTQDNARKHHKVQTIHRASLL